MIVLSGHGESVYWGGERRYDDQTRRSAWLVKHRRADVVFGKTRSSASALCYHTITRDDSVDSDARGGDSRK